MMVNGLHLYSAFIQSTVRFMPLIHPFRHTLTHQRRLAAMQGTNQLVRSNWGLGVLLRDTSKCPGWDRTGNLRLPEDSSTSWAILAPHITHQKWGNWTSHYLLKLNTDLFVASKECLLHLPSAGRTACLTSVAVMCGSITPYLGLGTVVLCSTYYKHSLQVACSICILNN